MTATPADVPAALYDAIAAELAPDQLVELASTIAWENYRSRFNRMFDIASDGFSEGAACLLPARDTVAA